MNANINITEQKLKELAKLDNYDFAELIDKSKGYQIEWFKMKVESQYPELENILENMSNDELVLYLESKYNLKFDAVIIYYITNTKN